MIRVYSRLDGWLAQRLRAQCRPCLLRFLYLPSRSLPSLPSLESLASLASLQSLVSRLPSLESRLPSLLSRLPSRLLLSRPLPPSLLSRLLSLLSRPDPELHHTTPHIHTRLSNPRPPCDFLARAQHATYSFLRPLFEPEPEPELEPDPEPELGVVLEEELELDPDAELEPEPELGVVLEEEVALDCCAELTGVEGDALPEGLVPLRTKRRRFWRCASSSVLWSVREA